MDVLFGSAAEAAVVRRPAAAGATVFGKTTVPEGLGDYGQTNNPWDVTRSPASPVPPAVSPPP